MKTQNIAITTHAPETLAHLTKKAQDQGQTVTKARPFIAFNPSEAVGMDMTPKAKPIRKCTVVEQLQSEAPIVPGSLDSILARVNMGKG